jgi:prepilin-type processing-associated H-X9-DG protein
MAMYCRFCYYDLRGQQTPRCPECGTAFAFDDPRSFLHKTPNRLERTMLWIRRRRRAPLVAMTILLLGCYAVADYQLPSANHSSLLAVLSRANLKVLMTEWMIQQHDHPEQRAFDIDAAMQDIRPSYSPWSERDAASRKLQLAYLLNCAPWFVVPTMVYLLLIAILLERRARRGVFALVLALSLVLFGSLSPRETATRFFPGSLAYLNDFVFLQGVDLTRSNSQQTRTIAAYDLQSFRNRSVRIVAFADGHVEALWDDRAKPLFREQGLAYPGEDE